MSDSNLFTRLVGLTLQICFIASFYVHCPCNSDDLKIVDFEGCGGSHPLHEGQFCHTSRSQECVLSKSLWKRWKRSLHIRAKG